MKDLIDRQALLAEYDRHHVGKPGRARKLIEDAPSAQPEIIRCKDCKWWGREDVFKDGSSVIICKKGLSANPEGFCHYAEMRGENR